MSDGFDRGPYRPRPQRCEGAVEGVHEDHCPHDLPPDDKHAPGSVCCWCGDIFLPLSDSNEHGEYLPKVMTIPEKPAAKKAPKRKKRS